MNRFLFASGIVCALCVMSNIFLLLCLGILFRDTSFGKDVKELFDFLAEKKLTGILFVTVCQIGLMWLFSGLRERRKNVRINTGSDEWFSHRIGSGGSGKN